MSSVEINVLLTQADRHAYLAACNQRLQAHAASSSPLSWLTRCFQRPLIPDGESVVLGPCTMRFDTAGAWVRNPKGEMLHAWSTIAAGTVAPHHLFLWQEGLKALIVPIRALPAGMSVDELQQRLDAVWTAATAATTSNASLKDLADKAASAA